MRQIAVKILIIKLIKIILHKIFYQFLLINLVLVVIIYILEPKEGRRTFDFICFGSLKLYGYLFL